VTGTVELLAKVARIKNSVFGVTVQSVASASACASAAAKLKALVLLLAASAL
jgi:hypothetical protein